MNSTEVASPCGSPLTEGLGLPVAAYEVSERVQIVACKQRDGSRLWAVRRDGCSALNKNGEWEFESLPSSRDAAYLARCRYATPLEAHDAYMRYLRA